MKKRPPQFAYRRGLAPLELVISVPLLLFAVALSVIFGAVTCWKVRGEVAARDAVFSSRWPRSGALPRSPEWRVFNSSRGVQGGPELTVLNDPVFQNPLIRGPMPAGIAVDSEMLDPKNHARIGDSHLTRDPPALGKLGPYSIDVQQPLLDGKWQFRQLGYSSNGSRRLRQLYDLLNVPGALGPKSVYLQKQQVTIQI